MIDPCAHCVLDYPWCIGWGDGGSDPNYSGGGSDSHTYYNSGQYLVTVTDPNGNVLGGNWVTVKSNAQPTLAAIPDQIVSTGDAVTVSSTASDVYNPNYEGYVNWGDGTGMYLTDIGFTGSSATLTAKLDAAGDPGQYAGSLSLCGVNEPDNHSGYQDTKSFNVDVWGAKLGDGSNNIIMQASDDGTQNLVPLTLYYPRPAGVATSLNLTISNSGEAVVWNTNDPEDETPEGTPVLGQSDTTVTLNAEAGDFQRTVWVGATEGSAALNDLFFSLAAETPGATTGPSTSSSSQGSTSFKVTMVLASDPNTGANNVDLTASTSNRNWVVGQVADVTAKVDAPAALTTTLKYQWSIPGVILTSYTPTLGAATEKSVSKNVAEAKWFWVTGPSGGAATVKITVTDASGVDHTASSNFNLLTPTVSVTVPSPGFNSPFIGQVNNDWILQAGNYGSRLVASVQDPTGIGSAHGNWTYAQVLFSEDRIETWAGTKITSYHASTNGKDGLDHEVATTTNPPWAFAQTNIFYQGQPVSSSLLSTGQNSYLFQDVPGSTLSASDMVKTSSDPNAPKTTVWPNEIIRDDAYYTYVMYLPPGNGSQWVPLKMDIWSWSADAQKLANNGWKLISKTGVSIQAPKAPSGEPLWSVDWQSYEWVM